MRFPVILCVLAVFFAASRVDAQRRPFEIMDNSFLVEEAYNQEAGIFQNIFLFQRAKSGGGWSVEFTQEWPVGSQRHQLSFTLPFDFESGSVGNVLLNYRLQSRMENESGPAIAPRLSVILPTGDDLLEYGAQLNVPVSRQFGDVMLTANLGATMERHDYSLESVQLLSPHLAGSLIFRALPLFHLMVETVMTSEQTPPAVCCDTDRVKTWIVSPGARGAFNFGDHQLAYGAAVPLVISQSKSAPYETSLVLYLSYELPFKKQ